MSYTFLKPQPQVLIKSTTTLGAITRKSGSGSGARAYAAVRLVHRVEIDVGFQIAQFTGRGEVSTHWARGCPNAC
jgi:hypothetical protein